ncbi:MAG: electron transport complex subunit RsxA [Kiritimatiellia bacterium]|jgi:electron transport complex protein RnfA|nr:electron transport complex subunit RsxA [Kiritimatiellia bacterium]
MASYFLIIAGAVLVNNFVLTRFLGICPFLGVSKKLDTALGMCGAVIFVMTSASAVTWGVQRFLLAPEGVFGKDLRYLQIIAFILIIASFVQLVDIAMKRFSPNLHGALGIFLPLITTNCAVMGVAVLNVQLEYNFIKAVVFGFAAALGFAVALVIFTGLREKIDRANPPKAFQGVAIALVTAGLLSLAFMGFASLVK